MNAGLEAYNRLVEAQRNRPSPERMEQWEAEKQRDEANRNIKRRLPKIA